MSKTEEDVAQNLTRLNDEVINLLIAEYDMQISKWKTPISKVIDAYNEAVTQVNKVIDEVKSNQKAAQELVLGALLLVGGKAVGWIAPLAKEKLQSKYQARWADMFVDGEYFAYTKKTPGEARAMYFGAVIEPTMNLVTSNAIKRLFPADAKPDNAAFTSLHSAPYATFKTSFEAVFNKEIEITKIHLGRMKHDATLSSNFGRELIGELKRLPAYSRRTTLDQLEEAGKIRILTDYDKVRNEWAQKWFYFGNDPLDEHRMRWTNLADEMEVALWALWVREQDFKAVSIAPMNIKIVMGKDKVPPAHPIMSRLVKGLFQTALIDLEWNSHSSMRKALVVGPLFEGQIGPGDLPKLHNWAKNRPSPDSVGKALYQKRAIGTLRDKTSIFKN